MRRFFWLIFVATGAAAQVPTVEARLEPDSVAIGDRVTLEVTVEKDMMQVVDFPSFDTGQLTEYIEVSEQSAVDTLEKNGRRVKLVRRYVLTTFEDGVHPLGRFPVLYMDKNIVDTLQSADSLVLKVGTYEIESPSVGQGRNPFRQIVRSLGRLFGGGESELRDIKPVMGAPFRVGELSGYVLWGLLAMVVAGLAVWWIVTSRRNLTLLGRPKPVVPPHVVAIRELEALSSQKLWQNNKHKQYYTRLTDILRTYIVGRWGVAAMEMTSDEIIVALDDEPMPPREFDHLKDILKAADLVKFAKLMPEAEENEAAYTSAYYFVEGTKPTEQEDVPAINPEEIEL